MARIKLTIPERRIFCTEIPVRITDINYGNHLGNDALVSMLHEARFQWLAAGGYSELNVEGGALIMSDLAVQYKAQSFYGDILSFVIAADEVSAKSFELYYEVSALRKGEKIIVALAKTGLVCFDYGQKKVAVMPEQFLAYINEQKIY